MRRPIGPQQPSSPRGLEPVAIGAAINPRAQDVGDAIASWMASGSSYFPVPIPPPAKQPPPPVQGQWPMLAPQVEYGELVCGFFVPPGHVAWVHDVEIAPYMHPVLFAPPNQANAPPPFRSDGVGFAGWHWQTGPVWESFPVFVAGQQGPLWSWAILACPGNITRRRPAPPAFSVPVPVGQVERLGLQSIYQGQLPQGAIYSRVPIVGAARGSEGAWNVQVGENTTIVLVVRGRNPFVNLAALTPQWLPPATPAFAGSFGRLRGYIQKTQTAAARKNASRGLGS